MKQTDFQKFKEGIEGVHSFYNKELSGFALDVWWNALKAYDLSAVIDSFNRHLMNPDSGQWLPKPADIVKMFGGRTQDRAMQAWSKVDRSIRCVGTWESVAFDDPLIHRVIHEMGGWIGLGQKSEDEWPFVAKEFETRYRGYAMRSETPDYPPILIGISEAHNSEKGLKTDLPRLIGNPSVAESVISNGSQVNLIGMARASESAVKMLEDAA